MTTSDINMKDLRSVDLQSLKARDRILKMACCLFNQYGVYTVGIDRIIAESEVSKRTFYNHFASKNDLIAAYLESKDWLRFSNLDKLISQVKGGPKAEILAVFDGLEAWFSEEDFNGCAFARGLSDFNNEESTMLRAKVDLHFANWNAFIKKRLEALFPTDKVKIILPQIVTVITGSVIVAQGLKDPKVAQLNKKIAEGILNN